MLPSAVLPHGGYQRLRDQPAVQRLTNPSPIAEASAQAMPPHRSSLRLPENDEDHRRHHEREGERDQHPPPPFRHDHRISSQYAAQSLSHHAMGGIAKSRSTSRITAQMNDTTIFTGFIT